MLKRKYHEEEQDNNYNKKIKYDIQQENDDLTEIKLQIKELSLNIAFLQRIIQQQNMLLNSIFNYNNPIFTEPPSYIS
jgi:hypothetical protein